MAGEIEILKRFIASAIPAIVEKGFEVPEEGWMGHYVLATGYDDSTELFTLQDSYYGPDQVMTYHDLELLCLRMVTKPLQPKSALRVLLEKRFEPLNANFSHFWIYRIAKAFTFPLESNLNIDKNRLTSSVGGFWQIDVPSRICSEPPSPFPEVAKSFAEHRR